MKRFIISILAFAVLLYMTTLCLDKVITIGLMQNETNHFKTLSKINQGKINADLIVSGSSKALVQVDPVIIDSVLGVNSYNFGLDGNPFIPQRALYEIYRKKNTKPKIIIQIVSNGTLRSLKEGFAVPIRFAPYLDIPEVKKLMKLTSSFNYLDYSIPMIRYSGKPFEIIIGGLSFFNIQFLNTTDIKGYDPHDTSWPESSNESLDISEKTEDLTSSNNLENIELFTSLDSVSCENFESFLANCEAENIMVFLVYPPIYVESFNSIKHVDYYKRVAQEYNAYFLDYSQDSLLAFNKKYFYNSQHLNLKGATIFTNRLSEDIKAETQNILNKE
jgi:hypothetical protein